MGPHDRFIYDNIMKKFYHDNTYLDLIRPIFLTGTEKSDRTGTGTLRVFGYQVRFNLENGTIPLLTTKKMHARSIIYEILWYLRDDTNIKHLNDNGVRIWNERPAPDGELGPGYQWRNWLQTMKLLNMIIITHALK